MGGDGGNDGNGANGDNGKNESSGINASVLCPGKHGNVEVMEEWEEGDDIQVMEVMEEISQLLFLIMISIYWISLNNHKIKMHCIQYIESNWINKRNIIQWRM